jgi:signal transduction histidine kinase
VERIMIPGNGGPTTIGTGPQYEYSARILQLAADRWLARTTLADQPRGAIAKEIHTYAERMGLEFPSVLHQCDDADLEALRWLLPNLASMAQLIVEAAVGRAIQLLSSEASFHSAVEKSSRRQVYNLAYGLTHEINNPLGNIVARAQRLMGDVADPAARKSLATMMDQAMRAHEMLAEAMRAVQPPSYPLVAMEMGAIVQQAWKSLQDRAREARVRWDCDSITDRIFADAHAPSLLDALRMLGLNSIDACGPNDAASWGCESVVRGAEERIRITLSDTGPGLSPQAQRSATDLYYSGREHGRGLGCSLAIVLRIVEMHRGTFAMRSEDGAGCRMEIELPKVQAPRNTRPTLRL